jgi:hypothetical protein
MLAFNVLWLPLMTGLIVDALASLVSAARQTKKPPETTLKRFDTTHSFTKTEGGEYSRRFTKPGRPVYLSPRETASD